MPTVSWPRSNALRLFAAGLLALSGALASAEDSFGKVERVVAVGDVHGDYDQLVTVLPGNKTVADLVNLTPGLRNSAGENPGSNAVNIDREISTWWE